MNSLIEYVKSNPLVATLTIINIIAGIINLVKIVKDNRNKVQSEYICRHFSQICDNEQIDKQLKENPFIHDGYDQNKAIIIVCYDDYKKELKHHRKIKFRYVWYKMRMKLNELCNIKGSSIDIEKFWKDNINYYTNCYKDMADKITTDNK